MVSLWYSQASDTLNIKGGGSMKILLIGNGGREHAIAWKVAQSPQVEIVYCAPGNGGTAFEDKCTNVELNTIDELSEFALREKIDLTIVGPEAKLVEGIVDCFKEKGLKIFGPSKQAAELEGSKAFAKEFMKKYGVKTAAYETFQEEAEALDYIKKCEYPLVIKADGLAAGKGVVICQSEEEAEKTIKEFMIDDIFKGSGKTIVIEEFLEGVEASILSITDGNVIIPFLSAKDHKCIFDKDKGPNTGGMGAITPNPYCTDAVLEAFNKDMLEPTLKGIKAEAMDYSGIIFFGLMITKKGCYLLEYNVRMGDPETQVVLPMMKTDFVDLILAACDKKLSGHSVEWEQGAACCVVAASEGYPGKYTTGYEICYKNLKGKMFAAGASQSKDKLVTSGGRVLSVVNKGSNLQESIKNAYEDIAKVNFQGIYYRKDIGTLYK